MIDATDIRTIPKNIDSSIFEYIYALPTDVIEKIKDSNIEYSCDVRCVVEEYVSPFSSSAVMLYENLKNILNEHSLVGYHATRVLKEDHIRDLGLYTNAWLQYKESMINILNLLGVSNDEVDEVIKIIKKEYERKYLDIYRNGDICFFSGMNIFEDEEGGAAYDQFCESIGGELARWALKEKYPSVYKRLKENGKGVVIKLAIPFINISESSKESIIYQIICYYFAKYFWDYEYEIVFDFISEKNVLPEQILEIIPFEKEIDY